MRFCSFILLLFLSDQVYSQNLFTNFYSDTSLHGSFNLVIETSDSGCITTISSPSAGGYPFGIKKFDSGGNNTWSKHYDLTGCIIFFNDLIELKNHGFALTGTLQSYPNNNFQTFFIMRIDSIGNLLSFRIEGDSAHTCYGTVDIVNSTYDNGLIFTGIRMINQDCQAFIARIDSSDNIQWIYYFQPDTSSYITDMRSVQLENGEIYSTGFCGYINGNRPHFFAMNFDSSGVLNWSKHLSSDFLNVYPASKPIAVNGKIYSVFVENTFTDYSTHVFCVDTFQRSLLWHVHYDTLIGNSGNGILKLNQNKIILLASIDDFDFHQFVNAEIDSNGAIVKDKLYDFPMGIHADFISGYENYQGELVLYGAIAYPILGQIFSSVDSLYSSECYSSDIVLPPPTYENDSLISSVPSMAPGALTFDDLSTIFQVSSYFTYPENFCFILNSAENSFTEVSISPNPAKDEFKIQTANSMIEYIELYDLPGKKVENVCYSIVKTEARVSIEKLHTGIYFVRVHTESGSYVQKLIIQ